MPSNRKRPRQQKRTKPVRNTESSRNKSQRIVFSPVRPEIRDSRPKLLTLFDWINGVPAFLLQLKNNLKYISRSRRIGILFLLLGILLLCFPYLTRFFTQVSVDEIPIRADANFNSTPTVEKVPIQIIIPSLQIDLPISPSRLIKGYWEVSEHTASYGLGSAPPGNVGNTVIFAHAREGLFLPLKNITFGKDIYVLSPDKWYQYRVDEIREVLPTDVYVVNKTEDNRLTLFTCTGFLDSKRLVVIAKPVKN